MTVRWSTTHLFYFFLLLHSERRIFSSPSSSINSKKNKLSFFKMINNKETIKNINQLGQFFRSAPSLPVQQLSLVRNKEFCPFLFLSFHIYNSVTVVSLIDRFFFFLFRLSLNIDIVHLAVFFIYLSLHNCLIRDPICKFSTLYIKMK
jgi:hypothetical protein